MDIMLKFAITFAALTGFSALLVVSVCRLYDRSAYVPTEGVYRIIGIVTFIGTGSCFGLLATLLYIMWRFI